MAPRKQTFPRAEVWPLDRLRPSDYNPRTISDESLQRLRASVEALGNLSPITVNARTGNIVGGHQRLRILAEIGRKDTEVWLVDLDEDQEKAANLALNNLAGEWDITALRKIIEDLQVADVDLAVTGFSEEKLQGLIDELQNDDDKAGDSPELAVRFEVIVECANEGEQQHVFARLQKEGKKCRVLTL